jgi:hypothetical protein
MATRVARNFGEGTAMPENPLLDPPRTSDPAATTDEPPAADRAGGVGIPARASNPAARYRLGEEIARGGMVVIHRATDTVLGREVVVKVLQEKYAPDSGTARRFALYLRRLERGTFAFPTAQDAGVPVTPTQLAMILGGLDPAAARQLRRYKTPG